MEFQIPDFMPAIAELFMAGAAVLLLLIVAFAKRQAAELVYWGVHLSLLVAAVLTYHGAGEVGFTFGDGYLDDPMGDVLKIVACLATSLSLLYSRRYLIERQLHTPEFYLLTLFATLGIMVLISAGSLLTIYLGLELMSLSLYALVAIDRDSARATEAACSAFSRTWAEIVLVLASPFARATSASAKR